MGEEGVGGGVECAGEEGRGGMVICGGSSSTGCAWRVNLRRGGVTGVYTGSSSFLIASSTTSSTVSNGVEVSDVGEEATETVSLVESPSLESVVRTTAIAACFFTRLGGVGVEVAVGFSITAVSIIFFFFSVHSSELSFSGRVQQKIFFIQLNSGKLY